MSGKVKIEVPNHSRRGTALVLSALLCLAFVPVIGLAIDGGSAYLMRAAVSTAADAAALAGARSLNSGQNISAQADHATGIAQKLFDANMMGARGATNVSRSVTVGQNDTTRMRWVTVTASADLPMLFLPFIGVNVGHVSFSATAQRRDVNVVLVLDHSGSMAGAIAEMRRSAIAFVDMFAPGRDTLGLITFTGGTFIAYHPSINFHSDSPSVTDLVGQLATQNGATSTAQAMTAAWNELKALNQPGALNVVVLFTDGLANTFAADFTPFITPAAGCTDMTIAKTGVLLADISGQHVAGLSDPVSASLNDSAENRPAPNSDGCYWNTDLPGRRWNIGSYLTGIPDHDSSGNSTNGSGTITAYSAVDLTQVNGVNVTAAGLNALDDSASRIRQDSVFRPLIYVIGLGSNPGFPPDNVLMARVANDPSSASFNTTQPAGLYVFSPTTAQLHSAFIRVASEILRLAI